VLNWVALFVALSAMALMLRALSRKLGDALHMKRYYLLYDASVAVLAISLASILLDYPGTTLPSRLLFVAGAVLMAGITVRYWGWIIPEILKRSE
jgi:hypothetical protein